MFIKVKLISPSVLSEVEELIFIIKKIPRINNLQLRIACHWTAQRLSNIVLLNIKELFSLCTIEPFLSHKRLRFDRVSGLDYAEWHWEDFLAFLFHKADTVFVRERSFTVSRMCCHLITVSKHEPGNIRDVSLKILNMACNKNNLSMYFSHLQNN